MTNHHFDLLSSSADCEKHDTFGKCIEILMDLRSGPWHKLCGCFRAHFPNVARFRTILETRDIKFISETTLYTYLFGRYKEYEDFEYSYYINIILNADHNIFINVLKYFDKNSEFYDYLPEEIRILLDIKNFDEMFNDEAFLSYLSNFQIYYMYHKKSKMWIRSRDGKMIPTTKEILHRYLPIMYYNFLKCVESKKLYLEMKIFIETLKEAAKLDDTDTVPVPKSLINALCLE